MLGDNWSTEPKPPPEYAEVRSAPLPSTRMRTTLSKNSLDKERTKEVFDRYDLNNSGEIDLREISTVVLSLGLSMDREAINNGAYMHWVRR